MSDTLELGFAEPRPADVAEIEAAIAAMWRSAGEGADSPVTRATALTLLVYVDSPEAGEDISNLIAEVARENPCRAIVMLVEQADSPVGITASVSAHCHLSAESGKQVCSEQITLRTRGAAGPELVSVVLPLTLSGLPIYLWWRAGNFAIPEAFNPILRVTDHLVVDSARFRQPGADLHRLAASLAGWAGRVRLSDLNWARATPWREVVAQSFDSPTRLPFLDRVRELRIEYEVQSTRLAIQRAESLLLSAWFASRLGWSFQRAEALGEERTLHFHAGRGEVKVTWVAKEVAGGGCGHCFSFIIAAEGARFAYSRGTDGKVVQTLAEVEGLPPMSRTVRIEVRSDAELLSDELMLSGHDVVYEQVLSLAEKMA